MGKSTPKAPPPPNPQATAQAQSQANRDAIRESALVNRYNVKAPGYSVTWRPGGYNPQGVVNGQSSVSGAPAPGYQAPSTNPGQARPVGQWQGALSQLQGGSAQALPAMSFTGQSSLPASSSNSMSLTAGPSGAMQARAGGIPNRAALNQFMANMSGNNAASGSVTGAFGGDPLYGMTQEITLDPQQQRIFDLQSQVSEDLSGRALDMAGQLPDSPLTTDGLPDQVAGINMANLPSVSQANLQSSVNNPGVANNVVSQGGNLTTNIGNAQQARGVGGAGQGIQRNFADRSGQMDLSRVNAAQQGAVTGAGQGIQRGLQQTQLDSGFQNMSGQIQRGAPQAERMAAVSGPNPNQYQTSVQQQRGGAVDAQQFGDLRSEVAARDLQRGVDTTAQDFARNIQTGDLAGLETDFAGQRANVESAVFERANSLLEPEFNQQREQLLRNLADRGIPLTSEQGARELDRLDRMQGEQRDRLAMSAVQAGGAEQSRLFDLASRSRGQMVDERLATGAFRNAALGQMFNQNLSAGQFANQAQGQEFEQGVTQAALNNEAAGQAFNQSLSAQEQANRAAQMNFGQGVTNAQLNNDVRATTFNQGLAAQNQANQAAQGNFAQNVQRQQLSNQATAQAQGLDAQARQNANQAQQAQFQQRALAGEFGNQAQAQAFAQRQAQQAQANQAAQANFQNSLASQQAFNQNQAQAQGLSNEARQLGNQAQGQFFGQRLAGQDQFNAAANQNFQNRLAGAQFGNQSLAQRQALNESAQAADNRARAQFFGQNLDAANFGNQAQTAQIGLEQARRDSALQEALLNANMQNSARATGLNERQMLRNQQLNELSGLIQGAPAMPMPGPIDPGALQMQAPDVAGLIMGNYNQQVNNAQQAAAARNAGVSNVANAAATIGSALIMSDPAIKHDVGEPERFLDRVKRLPIKTWRYDHAPDHLHIGPMATDWADLFGGDGKTISIVDAVGVILKSVQELTERVEAVEAV